MGEDRREHPRLEFRSEVKVEPPAQAPFTAWAINVSKGGVCLSSAHQLRSAEKVRLWFQLGEAEAFALSASVRYATRVTTQIDGEDTGGYYVVGVMFDELQAHERQRLDLLLEVAAADDEP